MPLVKDAGSAAHPSAGSAEVAILRTTIHDATALTNISYALGWAGGVRTGSCGARAGSSGVTT